MRRLHPFRRVSVTALVVAAFLGAVTASGTAGATGGTVTCGLVHGHQSGASELFNCSPAATTGESGTIATPIFTGSATGTIDWSKLSSSSHAQTVIHVVTKTVTRKRTKCPSGTTELKVSGRVRSDTSGSATVGGRVAGTLCLDPGGSYALQANTSFVIG
jgi:hypothetical protein